MHTYLLIRQDGSTAFLHNHPSSLGGPFSDFNGDVFPFNQFSVNGEPYTVLSHMLACTYNGLPPNPTALALTGRDFYSDVLVSSRSGNFSPLLASLNANLAT